MKQNKRKRTVDPGAASGPLVCLLARESLRLGAARVVHQHREEKLGALAVGGSHMDLRVV